MVTRTTEDSAPGAALRPDAPGPAAPPGRAGDADGRAGRGGDGGGQDRTARGSVARAAAQRAAVRHDPEPAHGRAGDDHPALLPPRRWRSLPPKADQGPAAVGRQEE